MEEDETAIRKVGEISIASSTLEKPKIGGNEGKTMGKSSSMASGKVEFQKISKKEVLPGCFIETWDLP